MSERPPAADDGVPPIGYAASAGARRSLLGARAPRVASRSFGSPRTIRGPWVGGAALALAAVFFATNGIQTAFAILALLAVVSLCHRPGEPPALLYAGVYQWLQASMDLLQSDFRGDHLLDRWLGPETVEATYLTLIAVVCFSVAARLGAGRAPLVPRPVVEDGLRSLSMPRLVAAWAAMFVIAVVVSAAAAKLPAIAQFMLAFAQLRWALVVLLAAWAFKCDRGYSVLAVVILVEALYGLLGYFSAFKNAFVIAVIGMTFVTWANPRKVKLVVAVLAPVVLLLGVYWTSMKGDYRKFVNAGTGEQVVLVTPQEQLAEVANLAAAQSADDLADAAEKMLARIGYVYYFASAINYVPAVVPHQDGALWLKSIWHVLVPRVIDPDKPAIEDSERTAEFTGFRVAGAMEGTSIGLGYVAESYVDFGPVLMFVPIFLWGLVVGAGYRLLARSPASLVGVASGSVLVVFGASLIETSNTKMLGGFITALLVFLVVARIGGPVIVRALSRPRSVR